MKIEAYQIDPAVQESNLFYVKDGRIRWEDCGWEDVSLIPRKGYFYTMSGVVEEVYEKLENGEYLDDPELSGKLAPVAELIKNYSWDYLRQTETLCAVCSIVDNREYVYKTIRGCCQDDWQTIVYPFTAYTKKDIETFEIMFFNTGTEYVVHESTPDYDGETGIYCCNYRIEDIRQEIADAFNVNASDVVIHKFAGYKKIPQYETI